MAFADYDKIVLFGDSITEQSYDQARQVSTLKSDIGFREADDSSCGSEDLDLVPLLQMSIDEKLKWSAEDSGSFSATYEWDTGTDLIRDSRDTVSCSGYNTLHALELIPKIIPPPTATSRIRLITVFFGPNDATLPDRSQHVPLDQYSENLKRIINHPLLVAHSPRIILITPPPICEYRTQDSGLEKGILGIQRLAANTKKYADAALEVGKALGIPTVNLWEAFMQYAGGWEEGSPLPGSKELPRNEKLGELLRDGLHFEPKGLVHHNLDWTVTTIWYPANTLLRYRILYDLVLETIRENTPELDPENLEFVFPHHEKAPKSNFYTYGQA
ncbi:unnamed protein product [Tuber aestivum]|uniref:SGNH hydrolase-type esterase domain-containing protein n=1 Tax=Tuber aestivum TaxID=59557 RepID=A0A292Q557_9PEZI|nr:unnamed protein product [Tuber aestivum]